MVLTVHDPLGDLSQSLSGSEEILTGINYTFVAQSTIARTLASEPEWLLSSSPEAVCSLSNPTSDPYSRRVVCDSATTLTLKAHFSYSDSNGDKDESLLIAKKVVWSSDLKSRALRLYEVNCATCHQEIATSTKKGKKPESILSAILSNESMAAMPNLRLLNSTEIRAISIVLGETPSGDVEPPTVTITSPVHGDSLSGIISVHVNSNDNVSVGGVQLLIDGNKWGDEMTLTPYIFALDTTLLTNASHTISAIARDAANNSVTNSISVNVLNSTESPLDLTAPNVTMSSPLNGVSVVGEFQIKVNATDDVGVVGVKLKVNGVYSPIEKLSPPYIFSVNTMEYPDGSNLLITVEAKDATGNIGLATGNFIVANTLPSDAVKPVVSITSPISESTVNGDISVTINATDNVGVVGVKIEVDGVSYGSEDLASPYAVSVKMGSFSLGSSHSIVAKARDSDGNIGSSLPVIIHLPAEDKTPNAFTLTPVTGVNLATVIESNVILVSGINTETIISVAGDGTSEFSVNGGLYIKTPAIIKVGDSVKVRHKSSGLSSAMVSTKLSIGGIIGTFSTTTKVVDLQGPSTIALLPAKNSTNIDPWAPIQITFSENIFRGTGKLQIVKSAGNVVVQEILASSTENIILNGKTLTIKHMMLNSLTKYYLKIDKGFVKDELGNIFLGSVDPLAITFTIMAVDCTPNLIDFGHIFVEGGDTIYSISATVTGINTACRIAVTDIPLSSLGDVEPPTGKAQYSINGGTFTNNVGLIHNGDTIRLKDIAPAYSTSYDKITTIQILIGDGKFYASTYDGSFTFYTDFPAKVPTLIGSSPVDNALGLKLDSNFILEFSKFVTAGVGKIRIVKNVDNITVEEIAANDTTKVNIRYYYNDVIVKHKPLVANTDYHILVDSTAFSDMGGRKFVGITNSTSLNFKTGSGLPPPPPAICKTSPYTLSYGGYCYMTCNISSGPGSNCLITTLSHMNSIKYNCPSGQQVSIDWSVSSGCPSDSVGFKKGQPVGNRKLLYDHQPPLF